MAVSSVLAAAGRSDRVVGAGNGLPGNQIPVEALDHETRQQLLPLSRGDLVHGVPVWMPPKNLQCFLSTRAGRIAFSGSWPSFLNPIPRWHDIQQPHQTYEKSVNFVDFEHH
jgi:hypothetical protein